ncbi:CocE/NonD family hydrolase [Halotalea alkalilenta]|uniref:CocE/NonD family hydrolase n=1 Tax=Halotalea alkalilenta TaxID=376489 RepID=UPI000A43E8AA|nr:CocE/NonD family hydrolase [Halotalea alkalilenta]
MSSADTKIPSRIYGDDAYPVAFRKALPPTAPRARYPGFHPERTILKKGTIRREGARPLSCDILFERDVPLTLRDGVTIYTDIFRPVDDGQYPAIIAWSPYGKEIGGQWLDDLPGRSGVPLSLVSELQKFEGPDPAYWVEHGYVVLNPDPRGAYASEGNISYWGRQLAEDGYDFIEWAARQHWCSGRIALSGNSWLAVSQWFIAAEKPPHLTAIAPWEGFSDHFRESGNRGGIPMPAFPEAIIATFAGKNLVEDQPRMIVDEPLMSPYWEDKKARLERIEIPAYVVASYTNAAHTHGSFEGYRRISSKEKWLRVNNTNEWLDYYTPIYTEELRSFFDHYLKDQDNGWQRTPRVRICVLDPGGEDIVDREEAEWPLPCTTHDKLFLSRDGTLDPAPKQTAEEVAYAVESPGLIEFRHVFARMTELTGHMKLRLFVEARGSDDMELAVTVEKRDAQGQPFIRQLGEGAQGSVAATGFLRVSHRELDEERSTPSEPYLLHRREDPLSPGQIVAVEIAIWPMSMIYRPGEQLLLRIAAYRPTPTNFDMGFGTRVLRIPAVGTTFVPGTEVPMMELGGPAASSPPFVNQQRVPTPQSRNKGEHVFHLGGQYDSHLLVPVVRTS